MRALVFLLMIGLLLLLPAAAFAHDGTPEPGTPEPGAPAASAAAEDTHTAAGPAEVTTMRDIGWTPLPDAQLPSDLQLHDETGKAVKLGDYFGHGPILLSINYYSCEDLCPLELRSLVDAMNQVTFRLNTDYRALTVSLDPNDTAATASAMRDETVRRYKRPDAPDGAEGWHFLTGDQAAINALTQAIGMKYAYDTRSKSFAHPVGVVLLTPDGRIARYLYGMDFPPIELRLALYEASQGHISNPITPILLLCYHYDVASGRYTNIALGIVRGAGVLTMLTLGGFIGIMLRREAVGRKNGTPPPSVPPRGTEG